MALSHSPNTISDGLVFYCDAYNAKSWKGEPVVNQFICPNPYDSNNNVSFAVQGSGIFQRVYSGTYGGYTIKPTDVVYRYNLGSPGCHYHGNTAAIQAGQYVCYSVDYYVSPDAANFPTDGTLIVLENYGGALGGGTGVGGIGVKGAWQRIQGSVGPTSAPGSQAMFLYPGGCSSSFMASSGFILMKNPMFEFRSNVKYNTFVNGTRSNTQSLLDLTSNNTITANSLTYNSDGAFSFNGSSNYMSAPLSIGADPIVTINQWIRRTADFNNAGYWGLGGGAANNGINGYTSVQNKIGWDLWGQTTFHTGQDYPLNQWVNVCWVKTAPTFTTSTLKVYINGVEYPLTTTIRNNSSVVNITSGITVGRLTTAVSAYHAPGDVSTTQVYNRALSATEIQQNYNALKGRYSL